MAFYVGCINGGGIGLAPAKTGWQGDTNFSPPEPITEWDISRICQAGQEKDTPVMMGIKHANQASLISSLLDIGVFLIKVPTVEDEATVDAIIDVFYYPPLGKRSLSGSNNYGEGAKSLEPEGCFVAD